MATRDRLRQPGDHRLTGEAQPYPDEYGRDAHTAAVDTAPRATEPDPTEHIADPAPLGLAAFAATTFVLSVFNAGILTDEALEVVVLPLALFYGGLAQLLAGMWEFKKRNTFGATAFTSYGAFWLAYAAYAKFVKPDIPEASAHTATGLFLLVFTVFTAYMFIASLRVSGAIALVFLTLTATFVVLTIGDLSNTDSIVHVGGWLGLITAVCAWYASFATVANDTWKRTLLPTKPTKP